MKRLVAINLAIASAALTLSPAARADEPSQRAPGAAVSTHPPVQTSGLDPARDGPNLSLLFGGGALLVAAYAPAALAGGLGDRSEDRYLYAPVVGPWIDLARRDCESRPCTNEARNQTFLVASGVVQSLGALGIAAAPFVPEARERPAKSTLSIVFAGLPRDGCAVAAVGRF
ncbi:MAG: hypothetical protein U0235_00145 [Polyangiaceae bacterium]